jgi:cyclohexanone monooxygenase
MGDAPQAQSGEPALDFDPDALRDKYRAERDKRLREEGNDQYVEVKGQFAHYLEDPYVERVEREPLTDEVDVVIIGAGFGGLLAGARLREAGIESLRMIESGGDVGGTWYWNRYPGAQCDIEAYCYLPLIEELGYMPREKYSYAPEIFEHSKRIAKHYRLYDNACFQTWVTGMTWDEETARWTITTDRGDAMKARFVLTCTGPLNRPKLPSIPGLDDFKGHTFHTSRWDYEYTGGSHAGGLTKLADKRVAIIGTGATAIQSVPYVGEYAKQLYVFQRTPSSVDIRGNKPTDLDWFNALEPGWQRARRENFSNMVIGIPVKEDLVADGWTDIFRSLAAGFALGGERNKEITAEEAGRMAEMADFVKMNKVRKRVDDHVTDPDTAEMLKPWYRQFCKRPTFNDEYLPTFNRPNVKLVDTSETKGVERITEKGVVAGGVEYEVDCIIFSTGFEVGTSWVRRQSYDPVGKGGQPLSEHWADGMKTFHGFTTRGFPNYFLMGMSQNGFSVNLTHVLDDQARHIAHLITEVDKRQKRSMEPTEEAEAAWVAMIRSQAALGLAFLEACTPGYYNAEGRVGKPGAAPGLGMMGYAPGASAFNALMENWRAQGDLEGLVLE